MANWLQLTNNAYTTLASDCTAGTGTITPTAKTLFPDPEDDGGFYVTICDPDVENPTNDPTRETVKVTADSGGDWTVARAQCGTTARAHSAGDAVRLLLMAENVEEIQAEVDLNSAARHAAVTVADTTSVDLTLTGQQVSAAALPAGVDHDSLAGFVADEHIDWTVSQGGTLIHADNYVAGGGGTTYTAGDGLALDGTEFSLDPAWVDQAVTQAGTPQFGKVGLGAAAGTARITLVAGTTAVDGIDFGGDATLYRSDANVLKTDDTIDAVGGFKDNGTAGIDTTFVDADGNTITVSGGIITAKTAP